MVNSQKNSELLYLKKSIISADCDLLYTQAENHVNNTFASPNFGNGDYPSNLQVSMGI